MAQNLISELISTRLSHDIIGNIGAVANAVELLEEGDLDFLDDIKAILKTSSQVLSARCKFFRLAFGLDNANLQDEALVKKTAADYLLTLGNKDYPIGLEMDVREAEMRKKALKMIMVMADVMLRGGVLHVFEQNGELAAEIATESKIATEKLNKIEAFLQAPEEMATADMAPLCALANECGHQNLKLVRFNESIRLVMEQR